MAAARHPIPRARARWCAWLAAAALLIAASARAQPSETPAELLLFGLKSYRDGFYEPAADILRRYLALRPAGEGAASARYFLAEALRRSGMRKKAAAAYRDFLARHAGEKRAGEVRLRLGETLEKLGDTGGAVRAYASVRAGPMRAEALHRAAALHIQRREMMGAASALKKFLEAAPQDPRAEGAAFERALALDALSNLPEAEAAYRFALKRHPGSRRSRLARRRLGLSQHKRGRHEAAAATLSDLLKRSPGEGSRAEVRLALAASRYAREEYARAAEHFGAALSLTLSKSQRRKAERGAASALWEAGRYEQATAAYRRVIESAPAGEAPLGRYLRSIARSGGCDWVGRKALRFGLNTLGRGARLSLEDRFLLANCLQEAGMEVDATKRFEEVGRASPGSVEGGLADLRLAEFLEKSGHGKEASARYEKGVKTALALKDKKGGGVRHLLEAA
ncbi:MAG: tetratricopeptide repeat protein, partial [bacterium]